MYLKATVANTNFSFLFQIITKEVKHYAALQFICH